MLNSVLVGIINTGHKIGWGKDSHQFLALERAGVNIIFGDKREDCPS